MNEYSATEGGDGKALMEVAYGRLSLEMLMQQSLLHYSLLSRK
ncbi:MAG: hypothetical protein NZM11_13450 [Anaerolineales bacterium]|nr:hypothetical protein [Anaerolineales bacterium]